MQLLPLHVKDGDDPGADRGRGAYRSKNDLRLTRLGTFQTKRPSSMVAAVTPGSS